MGDIEALKEDLSYVSETKVNFVQGDGLIIATFSSSAHLSEIETFFNLGKRSYIIFEMTPGFFSANIANKEIQDAVFGGKIDNNKIGAQVEQVLSAFSLTMSGTATTSKLSKEEKTEIGEVTEEMFNKVLDKISKDNGMDNLSDVEKEILKKYSSK
jgi:hypothetical protein